MENHLLCFARLAHAVARRALPVLMSKYARSAYRPSSLFVALLVKEHLRLNYRGLEDLLRISGQLRRLFGFLSVPDHSTFWWFAHLWLSAELVAAALAETVCRVKRDGQRCQVALDSTRLWLGHTSWYFEWRAKGERGQRGWLKWALAMWVGPQMLLAQRVRPGPAGDFPDLVLLATDASAVMAFDEVIADAGYDSEANHRFCRETLRRPIPHPGEEAALDQGHRNHPIPTGGVPTAQ